MSAPEKIDKLYLHVRMGGFVKPDANSQMENQKGQAALAVGAGWRASRHFAAEIEFFGDHQVYSLKGNSDSHALETRGVVVTLKYTYPIRRFDTYIGGGIGRYELEQPGDCWVPSCPDATTAWETGFHAVTGLDFYFAKTHSVGAQIRVLNVSADLSPAIPGTTKAGGVFVLLSYQHYVF